MSIKYILSVLILFCALSATFAQQAFLFFYQLKIKNMKSFSIFIIFFICVLGSCTDPCKKMNCQAGNCVDGKCDCPPGYSGANCQYHDVCYNVKCQNGGTCNDGSCNCPTGYYGQYCQYRSACYFDNTGTISVQNLSASGRKYRVFVNGSYIGSPAYAETVVSLSLKVGTYNVQIYIEGTTTKACSDTQLNVVRCNNTGISCRY